MAEVYRSVTRRKMRRIRRRANSIYRSVRAPARWAVLDTHAKVRACVALASAGSQHRLCDPGGINGTLIRYAQRGVRVGT